MTALDDYLASPECRKKVEWWSLSTAMSGYSQDDQAIIDAGDAALNALCEQLREAQADPYKGQWKRKFMQAEAELTVAKRLNGKWMDERTEAIIRAEQVEAERDLAHDHILQLETELDTARAERDRARDTAAGLFEVCP